MASCCFSSPATISRSSSSIFQRIHHHRRHQQHLFVSVDSPKLRFNKLSLLSNPNPPSFPISAAAASQDGAVSTTVTHIENDIPLKKVKDAKLPVAPPEESKGITPFDLNKDKSSVTITVVGASGDLAKKKIFPALFALYYEDCLPEYFTIFGYARSKMTDAKLRDMVSKTLTCRIDKRANCERCFYHSGQYDSEANFAELDKKLKEHEY